MARPRELRCAPTIVDPDRRPEVRRRIVAIGESLQAPRQGKAEIKAAGLGLNVHRSDALVLIWRKAR